MTIEEIKETIEENEYDIYGLRMDNAEYEVGDECDASYQWWQDDPKDESSEYVEEMGLWKGEELSGTCAIRVTLKNVEKALEMVKIYNPGGNLYLIAGFSFETGYDNGEIIISDAEVILK